MQTRTSKSLISKESISKQILSKLRQEIILGSYKKGDRLLEVELAKRFQVSRGTLRTAVLELAGEGLVEFLDSGGCIVSGIDNKFISDTYDFRGMLEISAANIILTSNNISYTPLAAALDRFNSNHEETDSIEQYVDVDLNFHQALVQISDNKPIYRAWCQMSPVSKSLLSLNLSDDYLHEYLNKFYDHHKLILDYLILKDKRVIDELKEQNNSAKEKSIANLSMQKNTCS